MLEVITHTLSCIQTGTLTNISVGPIIMLNAHCGGTIGLGQAIHMSNIKTHFFHTFNHGCRGSGARHHCAHGMVNTLLHLSGGINQHVVHNGRPAVMSYMILTNSFKDILSIHFTETNIHSSSCGYCPWETPSIAMKKRQDPQINRVARHIPLQDIGDCIGICASMRVNHPFGVTGCSRGVI